MLVSAMATETHCYCPQVNLLLIWHVMWHVIWRVGHADHSACDVESKGSL
jgi:hypothetical protein